MNNTDYIIILILIIVISLGLKSTLQHLKGKGLCCGGESTIIEPDKVLKEEIIGKHIFKIEGMTCENCANRIKRSLNGINGISATVSYRKKEAIISYSKPMDVNELVSRIENLEYKVVSIS